MIAALRVAAGALAAGPAGIIWAFRESQQKGETTPNATLSSLVPAQEPSASQPYVAKLTVHLTSFSLNYRYDETVNITLQLGDSIQTVQENGGYITPNQPCQCSHTFSFTVLLSENLLIRIERGGMGGECVAKSFVPLTRVFAVGREGTVGVTLVGPNKLPSGSVEMTMMIEMEEKQPHSTSGFDTTTYRFDT